MSAGKTPETQEAGPRNAKTFIRGDARDTIEEAMEEEGHTTEEREETEERDDVEGLDPNPSTR